MLSLANLNALGADLMARDHSRRTPLHLAAQHNDCAAIETLLSLIGEEKEAEALEARSSDLSTVVHASVSAGAVEATRLLLTRRRGLVEAEKRDGARPSE